MKSRLAEELRRERERQAWAMTPEQRFAAALALGQRAIADYMENFGADRGEAVRALRRAGQAGRSYSRCMDDSLHG